VVDPADRSRCTLVYELDGGRGILDGRLDDDGYFVLSIRDGPASNVAASRATTDPVAADGPDKETVYRPVDDDRVREWAERMRQDRARGRRADQ
jgi:hypothetical protein